MKSCWGQAEDQVRQVSNVCATAYVCHASSLDHLLRRGVARESQGGDLKHYYVPSMMPFCLDLHDFIHFITHTAKTLLHLIYQASQTHSQWCDEPSSVN